ncbi:MAG: flavodoxin-dependent (E)-4-hydroxy-3-methylbut-2-enyl-diphosphate synthase [Candidatus Cloacimonetes bacterium]|nr:flavodoxin-dependent (E)-4-hydroxy-3-methylbut-2-enyl-diphosphate synthase [Candidatus Cloacimonadota bacterium]NLO11541.1 flavodoxin-dependent (E)-4-hydroxy-3-methylbut-2-enyl-diphosphate synthase [Candidatus Cloacimonadota bacterium]
MENINRKPTKRISLGKVEIGDNAPVSIQSMLSLPTAHVTACIKQLHELEAAGCEIVRMSVTDLKDAKALAILKRETKMPIVADIHFDYKLALAALEHGVDGLRLNPGNIGSREGVEQVVKASLERQIPIRIGVNSGSLPADLLSQYGLSPQSMVEAALRHVRILEELHFDQIKISVKASQLPLMVESYRLLSSLTDYPLHLGITESGSMLRGTIKSSIALGTLLQEGIGDTIRVSLTAPPLEEVNVAKEILKSLSLRKGLNIISCPTCGRTRINLMELVEKVETALAPYEDIPLTVAVMGCAVNGPGEAREADFGIAGGDGEGLVFARGEIIKKVPESQLVEELLAMIIAEVER